MSGIDSYFDARVPWRMWHTKCVGNRLCLRLYGAPVLMWYNKCVTERLLSRLYGSIESNLLHKVRAWEKWLLAHVAHQMCQKLCQKYMCQK